MKLADIATIVELASEYPESAPVLERLRIDYCCGGGRSVADACRDAKVTVEELESAIGERTDSTFTEKTGPISPRAPSSATFSTSTTRGRETIFWQ